MTKPVASAALDFRPIAHLFRDAAEVIASSDGVPVSQILRPTGRAAKRLRHVAAYLVVTTAGVPTNRLSRAVGVSRCAIRHGLAAVEDMRDAPEIDARLSRLEDAFSQRIAA